MTTLRHHTLRFLQNDTAKVLLFVSLLDAAALFLYWLYTKEILHGRFFRLGRDRGAGEIVQYLKVSLVIFMLWETYKQHSSKILKAWIFFFIALLLDDATGIHEEIGDALLSVYSITPPDGMRAKDIAELFGFALIEGTIALYLFFCFLSAPIELKKYSFYLGCALAPLAFSGLVLDNTDLFMMEEAGEILGATILFCFVHIKYRQQLTSTSPPI